MNEEKSCQSVYHWSLIGREAGAGRNDKLNKTYNRRILFGIYSRKLLASMSSTTHWKMSGHLVSLIKHHGLFAHTLLSFLHPIQRSLTRKSWLNLHSRHWIQGYFVLIHVTRSNGSFILLLSGIVLKLNTPVRRLLLHTFVINTVVKRFNQTDYSRFSFRISR